MKSHKWKFDSMTSNDIKTRAIKSVKWTALAEILSRSIQPVVMLILARLLLPSDFGIVGVAMIAIGLAQVFRDFGLGKTLIQREDEVEASANVIFWMNVALGAVLYLVIFTTSPIIAKFFHEPRTIDVLRVLCLQIVIASFFSVHLALLQRSLQFKPIFLARLGASITPGIVSIPMALMGRGVWALVWGSLTGSIVQLTLFWKLNPWRPKWNFDISLVRKLLSFSSWVTLEAFLGWLILWGDSIVLGHFLGVKELGIYRVGVTFLMLIFGTFFNPIIPITYSSFSRLQSNLSEVKRSFLKMIQLIAAISLPLGFGLAILAKPIASVVLGQKWQGIELVVLILGVMYGISWLVGINPEVYRAIGRPDINSKLLLAAIIYYFPVYILAAPHGLLVFCLARLGVAMIGMFLHLFVANRILHLSFTYLWEPIKIPLVGAVLMGFAVYGITNVVNSYNWFGLTLSIISGGIFYLLGLWIIKKEFVKWTLRHIMEIVR